MPIVFVTNYLTPYQVSLFSRDTDIIITYSRLEARRQWAPLKTEAQVKDVSRLSLGKRLHSISCLLNRSNYATLIGGSSRAPEFWLSIALCRLRRIPFAIWMERPRVPVGRLRRKVLRLALGERGRILAVGTLATNIYCQCMRGIQICNFPYSYGRKALVSPKLSAPKNSRTSQMSTALFIGAEWERKGLDILLRAIATMPGDLQSRLILRVAGLNALPTELEGIDGIAPSTEVAYLGFLEPHDIRKELSSVDVLIVPSRYDGWAVVVEEAMAEGTPVIASDRVGAAADLVVDGYSGFTFASGDVDALAAAMAAAMCHDASIQPLSVGAVAIITRHRNIYNIESLERALYGGLELASQPAENVESFRL
jgi:glycosyltransferase involved in cell wall biosynthesis